MPDICYQVLAHIATGETAAVYQARDLHLGRVVALKLIPPSTRTPAVLHGLVREAQILASMSGQAHVVKVYAVVESQGLPCMVMEYLAGGRLADRLDGRPWPAARAARLTEAVARALAAVHRRGLVHGDVTPRNILFTAAGEPKLAGFGTARRAHRPPAPLRVGPPMPPEPTAAGAAGVGPAADVYALGTILYELLTGRTAFDGAGDGPVPLRQWNRGVPHGLEAACLTCLEWQPERRHANAEALAAALQPFAAPEPAWRRALGVVRRAVRRERSR